MAGEDIRVRQAIAEDLPACADIVNDYIDATEWLPRTAPRVEIEKAFSPDLLTKRIVYVAEAAGAIVAYLSMSLEGWVAAIYIKPAHRGRGIGKRLIDCAKREPVDALELTVFEPNVAAKRFYEREGFRELPERRNDKTEEGVPTLLMRWQGNA